MHVKKKSYILLIALLMGIAMMLSPLVVKADTIDPFIVLDNTQGVSSVVASLNSVSKSVASIDIVDWDSSKRKITFFKSKYNLLSESEYKKQIMKGVLEIINKDTSMSSRDRNRLYSFIENEDVATSALVRQLSEDVSGDYATAYTWFKPFSGTVSTVMALLCMVIFICIAFTIIVDLAYLAIPAFRLFLDKTDNTKPKFISNEAFMSIKEAESDKNVYRSYLALYFKHKTFSMFLLCITLLYLISGKVYVLIAWVLDVLSGIVG